MGPAADPSTEATNGAFTSFMANEGMSHPQQAPQHPTDLTNSPSPEKLLPK